MCLAIAHHEPGKKAWFGAEYIGTAGSKVHSLNCNLSATAAVHGITLMGYCVRLHTAQTWLLHFCIHRLELGETVWWWHRLELRLGMLGSQNMLKFMSSVWIFDVMQFSVHLLLLLRLPALTCSQIMLLIYARLPEFMMLMATPINIAKP